MSLPFLIIDFDSTFVKVEGLEELAKISLINDPEYEKKMAELKAITNQGMEGKISFTESLKKRLSMLTLYKHEILKFGQDLRQQVTESFKENQEFFKTNAKYIYIISGGFRDFMAYVLHDYGILYNHILANTFRYTQTDRVIGFDETNILSQEQGKVKQVEQLELTGEVWVIGDGWTDYEIKESGKASKFFVFTENVKRDKVVKVSDHELISFSDIFKHINN